jgi:transcription antitermination protein nusG
MTKEEKEISEENTANEAEENAAIIESAEDDSIPKKWYAVHTYSGFEDNVKLALEERIVSSGLKKYFGDIIVPKEDIIEKTAKGGKKK